MQRRDNVVAQKIIVVRLKQIQEAFDERREAHDAISKRVIGAEHERERQRSQALCRLQQRGEVIAHEAWLHHTHHCLLRVERYATDHEPHQSPDEHALHAVGVHLSIVRVIGAAIVVVVVA